MTTPETAADYVRRNPMPWPAMTAEQREKAVAVLATTARPTAPARGTRKAAA